MADDVHRLGRHLHRRTRVEAPDPDGHRLVGQDVGRDDLQRGRPGSGPVVGAVERQGGAGVPSRGGSPAASPNQSGNRVVNSMPSPSAPNGSTQ